MSHAGTVLLAELADRIGLTALLSEATDGLRERRPGHDPDRVLIDVAVAITDGAVTISDIRALGDHEGPCGPAGTVASTPTICRVLAAIGKDQAARGGRLTPILQASPAQARPGQARPGQARPGQARPGQARPQARDRDRTARGELTGSELPDSRAAGMTVDEVVIDLDTTLVTADPKKEDARGNFKGRFRHHPLGACLDDTHEAPAMLLRPGNAWINTASNHPIVLEQALAQVPERWRIKIFRLRP